MVAALVAGVVEMAAALATEGAYAKASRLLGELAGIYLSARSVRSDAQQPSYVRRRRGAGIYLSARSVCSDSLSLAPAWA